MVTAAELPSGRVPCRAPPGLIPDSPRGCAPGSPPCSVGLHQPLRRTLRGAPPASPPDSPRIPPADAAAVGGRLGADRPTADRPPVTIPQLASYVDDTLRKPETSREQIATLCEEARQYGFASVCTNPVWTGSVRAAAGRQRRTDLRGGRDRRLPDRRRQRSRTPQLSPPRLPRATPAQPWLSAAAPDMHTVSGSWPAPRAPWSGTSEAFVAPLVVP